MCLGNAIFVVMVFLGLVPRSSFCPSLFSSVVTSLRHQCPLDRWLAVGFVSGKMGASEDQSTEGERTLGIPSWPSPLCFSVPFLAVVVYLQINTSHWTPCSNKSSPCPLSSRSGNSSSLLLVSSASLLCLFLSLIYTSVTGNFVQVSSPQSIRVNSVS